MGGYDVQKDTFSFVVRIWPEALDSDGNVIVWRGSIDDVGNGERSYFDDLNSVAPFIRKQIGWTGEVALSPLVSGGDQEQA
jgi:hypothetical protein